MPLFDYECGCGHRTEVLVPSPDVKEIECPLCQCIARQKFPISTPIFVGDGWFKDGYAKKGK
jgi:putative FmdB family regulatory protein